MKQTLLLTTVLMLAAQPVPACRADRAHNQTYHGDPDCLQCTCVHHIEEPSLTKTDWLSRAAVGERSREHTHGGHTHSHLPQPMVGAQPGTDQ